jgi:uncharacterized Zn finger protein
MPAIRDSVKYYNEDMNFQQHLATVDISSLAIPSNIMYGSAIYQRGAVELITQDDVGVEAWAGGLKGSVREGGGSRRRVQLRLEDAKLWWHCTGNPKNHDIFCKHCVAVALFLKNS